MSTVRYQVFISSTFSDLKEERQCLWQRLTDYGYIVAGMENFPSTSDEPFEYIKPLIENSDFFLLVLGDRYGSYFSDTGKSYTETEFDYAVSLGIPVLVLPIEEATAKAKRTSDIDQIAAEKLENFSRKSLQNRMVRRWATGEDLASLAIQALAFESTRKPRPGWVRGSTLSTHELSDEVVRLRQTIDQMEEKISKLPSISVEEMDLVLSNEICISSREKDTDEIENIWVSFKDLLRLESIFSEITAKSIRESMEIVCESDSFGGKYKNQKGGTPIGINSLDVDSVMLFLRRHGIIEFDIENSIEGVRRGRNWLTALEACKLSLLIRPSKSE